MPSEAKLIQQIQSHVDRLAQAVADVQFWHDRWLEQAEEEHRHCLAGLEASFQRTLVDAEAADETTYKRLCGDIDAISRFAGLPAAPWDDPLWESWAPTTDGNIPSFIRIGQLIERGEWNRLTMPALLPLIGGRNLVLKVSGKVKADVVPSVQSVTLRLLATLPAGKLRLLLIDPVGLGQNVAAFMHLADYDKALVSGKPWTEPQHIEAQLAGLTDRMELVIRGFLRDKYPTMEAYNAEADEVTEPYRLLVAMNFPVNFSEAAARRLVSIMTNGPRCGVYTLLTVDTEQPLPHGFNLADLERTATVIAWDGERFIWQDEDFRDCLLELDTSPPTTTFDRILKAVGKSAEAASRVKVPLAKVAPPPEQWWQGSTQDGLAAPIGLAGATKVQHLSLGRGTAQHALVAGKTGSGKSTLLHVLITTLAMTYPPDELELYLVDFKKGVEFKIYATQQLPHARVIAIESEREFGLSVLQRLDAELGRRGDLFRQSSADGLASFRQKNGQRLPRILLLVDEFQEFFTEDDAIASQSSMILDRLVRQGRAFGIHILLGSQTLAGTYTLARSTIGQMAVRIALQTSEADSHLILADDNAAARLLSRPGEAIYNASNGLVEGNSPFQVAWMPDGERLACLQRLREMAEERGYLPSQPTIVFEGNAPAEVAKNRQLQDLLTAPGWPANVGRVAAWHGEPVAIREPTAANFRRQNGSNLLIVGQNGEAALGMLAIALISLAAQHVPSSSMSGEEMGSRFYILDFSSVDVPFAELIAHLVALLPHGIQVTGRRGLPDVIGQVVGEVERRMEVEDAAAHPLYLLIYGLQRARDLRQEEDFSYSYGEEPSTPNPANQFITILREGPDVGVHTLVWCDTYTNLTRTLDRRALREFEMRVALQMGAEDSSNLIETPAASNLGLHRALYFSEEEGRLEKFRPYGLPSEAWLNWVGEQLRSR